jgi:hypothetical protein
MERLDDFCSSTDSRLQSRGSKVSRLPAGHRERRRYSQLLTSVETSPIVIESYVGGGKVNLPARNDNCIEADLACPVTSDRFAAAAVELRAFIAAFSPQEVITLETLGGRLGVRNPRWGKSCST